MPRPIRFQRAALNQLMGLSHEAVPSVEKNMKLQLDSTVHYAVGGTETGGVAIRFRGKSEHCDLLYQRFHVPFDEAAVATDDFVGLVTGDTLEAGIDLYDRAVGRLCIDDDHAVVAGRDVSVGPGHINVLRILDGQRLIVEPQGLGAGLRIAQVAGRQHGLQPLGARAAREQAPRRGIEPQPQRAGSRCSGSWLCRQTILAWCSAEARTLRRRLRFRCCGHVECVRARRCRARWR